MALYCTLHNMSLISENAILSVLRAKTRLQCPGNIKV